MTGMASSTRTRRLTGARRHAAATPTRTAAISKSAGRPATVPPTSSDWVGAPSFPGPNHTSPPTLNPPRISAAAPTRAVPLRVSRARPRSGPGESSSATAAVPESRTVNATAGSAYPAEHEEDDPGGAGRHRQVGQAEGSGELPVRVTGDATRHRLRDAELGQRGHQQQQW